MPNYNIIAVDLDGTLVDSHLNISEENKRAIHTLTEMGVQVVPATGRAFTEVDPRVRENPDIRYVICSAGAMTYDKQTKNAVTRLMSVEKTQQILDILADYDLAFCLHCGGNSYMDAVHWDQRMKRYEMTQYMRDFLLGVNKPVKEFMPFCRDNKAAEMFVIFFRNKEDQPECKRRVEALGGVITAASEPYNLEIYPAGVGKGPALLSLAERLGVDPAATIAVGDSPNDYTMIRDAGLSLAVSNAFAVIKEAADRVICSNDEHIMPYILENIITE